MKYRLNSLVTAQQWEPSIEMDGVRRIPANRVDLSKTRGILIDRPERHVAMTTFGDIELSARNWVVVFEGGVRTVFKHEEFCSLFMSPIDPHAADGQPLMGDDVREAVAKALHTNDHPTAVADDYYSYDNWRHKYAGLAQAAIDAIKRIYSEKQKGMP